MSNISLSKFIPHNNLSKKIWQNNDKIRRDVLEKLLAISEEFESYLDIDVVVDDVILTGSYANYNYTSYSDLDLHLIISYSKIDDNDEYL